MRDIIYILERMCSEPFQASYGEPVAYFTSEDEANGVCEFLNNILVSNVTRLGW